MFIYEKDGKLNFMVADNKPAKNDETPNITIGPDNSTPVGAEVTINGKAVKTSGGDDNKIEMFFPFYGSYNAGNTTDYFTKVPDEAYDLEYDEDENANIGYDQEAFWKKNQEFSLPKNVNDKIIQYCNEATENGGSLDVDIDLVFLGSDSVTMFYIYDSGKLSIHRDKPPTESYPYHITKVIKSGDEEGVFIFVPEGYEDWIGEYFKIDNETVTGCYAMG